MADAPHTDRNKLIAGDILSYSAGNSSLNPDSFRKVNNIDHRLSGLLKIFSSIHDTFRQNLPLIVSCYPAKTMSADGDSVFVDTYLRQANFSRAMMLGADRRMPTLVIAQPLALVELLVRHLESDLPLPEHLLVTLGGYCCPWSLETAIGEIAENRGCQTQIIVGYGMAEVAVGCLLAEK